MFLKHMTLRCSLFDPHQTTYRSNIGAYLISNNLASWGIKGDEIYVLIITLGEQSKVKLKGMHLNMFQSYLNFL